MKDFPDSIKNLVLKDLEIQESEDIITEEQLLQAITARVAYLFDLEAELLFSHLYRLDVSEKSLRRVLSEKSDEPIASRIAKLILTRQKQRIITKRDFGKPLDLEGWEW